MAQPIFAEPPAGAVPMDFDPFGMDFRSDPSRFHAMLFAASPGFITMEGVPSAFVASYAQVTRVLRDFKAFSSLKPKRMPGMQRVDFFNGLPVMNYSDPPDHTRRRKVVNPAFTPVRVARIEQEASSHADQLIEGVLARGTFEAMDELAKPLSINALLGSFMEIPVEQRHIFLNYIKTLPLLDRLQIDDPKPAAYLAAWEEGRRFCREQQELARRGKCSNLIGVIANSAEDGAIDDDEMMAMMIVLLIGGFSTVAGAIGVALMNLARTPGLAARIVAEPELADRHLEESLRLDPPVSLVMRFAAADTEVGGTTIPQGMPVYALIATACHDPAMFPDPYRFDVDRPNVKDHIAFGFGMHTCIGNAITRMIVPMVLRKVAARMPSLHIPDDGAIAWDTGTPRARHLKALTLAL